MEASFTYWKDGEHFLGYLDAYPDYQTQGETFEDLKEHLQDRQQDLSANLIPTP